MYVRVLEWAAIWLKCNNHKFSSSQCVIIANSHTHTHAQTPTHIHSHIKLSHPRFGARFRTSIVCVLFFAFISIKCDGELVLTHTYTHTHTLVGNRLMHGLLVNYVDATKALSRTLWHARQTDECKYFLLNKNKSDIERNELKFQRSNEFRRWFDAVWLPGQMVVLALEARECRNMMCI